MTFPGNRCIVRFSFVRDKEIRRNKRFLVGRWLIGYPIYKFQCESRRTFTRGSILLQIWEGAVKRDRKIASGCEANERVVAKGRDVGCLVRCYQVSLSML